MAERIAYLQAVVGADISSFRYAMQRVRDEIGLLGTHVNRVSETARLATYTISAPLTLMGAGFLKAATDFDAAMRDVNSKAQLTEAEFQSLNKEVMSFSQTVRANAVEVANALSVVYGAGVQNNEQAMKLMQEAVRMSEGTGGALQRTTEALVSAVNAFGSEVMPVERASDAIVRLYQDGIGTMDSFATSIGRLNPMLAALNIEIEEGYAILGYFTQRGLSAEEAGTAFNQMLTNTIKPSVAMQRSLRQLGVKGFGELIDDSGSLIEAFKLLVGTTDGSSEALGELFTNVRSMRAVNLLQNDIEGATEAVLAFQEAVEGSTELVWEEQMKSFAAQIDLLSSAFMNMSINIGNKLIPIVEPFVQGLTQIFIQIANLDEATTQATVAFGIFIAALFPLIWLFTSILTPAGLLTTAVIGLAGALMFDFAGVRTTVMNTINDLTGGFDGLAAAIGRVISAAFEDQTIPTFEDWSAGMLPESVNLGAPNTVTFTVGDQGMSLFDFWSANLQDQFPDWNAFYREIAADRSTAVGETFEFNLGTPIFTFGGLGADPNKHMSEQVDGLMMAYDQEVANARSQTSKGFFGRLIEQLEAELPLIEAELDRIFDTLRLSISEKVSTFFTNLANSFTVSSEESGEGGDTPFYSALKGLFSLDVGQISSDLRTQFDEAFPEVTSSIETFLSSLGTWIETTGLPTLSRSAGYIVGRLAGAIIQGLNDLPSLLSGAESKVGGITDFISNTVVDPFSQGFNEAIQDANINKLDSTNIIASASFLALAGSMLLSLTSAIKSVWTGAALLPLLGAIVGGIQKAFTAAIASSYFVSLSKTILNLIAASMIFSATLRVPTAVSVAFSALATNIMSGLASAFAAVSVAGSAVSTAIGGAVGAGVTGVVAASTKFSGIAAALLISITTAIKTAWTASALGPLAVAMITAISNSFLGGLAASSFGVLVKNIIAGIVSAFGVAGLAGVAVKGAVAGISVKILSLIAAGMIFSATVPGAIGAAFSSLAANIITGLTAALGAVSLTQAYIGAAVAGLASKIVNLIAAAMIFSSVVSSVVSTAFTALASNIVAGIASALTATTISAAPIAAALGLLLGNLIIPVAALTLSVGLLSLLFDNLELDFGSGTPVGSGTGIGLTQSDTGGTIGFFSGGGGGGFGVGGIGGIGGSSGGGRDIGFRANATGGMLRGGVPYLVGEAGRELFVPTTDGRLYPSFRTNEMMRSSRRQESSAVVTNNITINGVQDFDTFVSEMQRRGISFKS